MQKPKISLDFLDRDLHIEKSTKFLEDLVGQPRPLQLFVDAVIPRPKSSNFRLTETSREQDITTSAIKSSRILSDSYQKLQMVELSERKETSEKLLGVEPVVIIQPIKRE